MHFLHSKVNGNHLNLHHNLKESLFPVRINPNMVIGVFLIY